MDVFVEIPFKKEQKRPFTRAATADNARKFKRSVDLAPRQIAAALPRMHLELV